jgi:hypothetical protein
MFPELAQRFHFRPEVHAERAEHAIDLGQLIAQPLRGSPGTNGRSFHVGEVASRLLHARGELLHGWRDLDAEGFHLRHRLGRGRADAREFGFGEFRGAADPVDGFRHQGRVLNELPPRERIDHLVQGGFDLAGAGFKRAERYFSLGAGGVERFEVGEEFA